MEEVISSFLRNQKIPISKDYCKKLILSHPDHPSLLSIADTFERLGINYNVSRFKKEDLEGLDFPYLLPLSMGQGEIISIENQADFEKKQDELQYWDGVVIRTESKPVLTDAENKESYAKDRLLKVLTGFFITTITAILLWPFIQFFSWLHTILLLVAAAGGAVGYVLIAKDLGIKYQTVESFCNTGKNSNCDQILNSSGATVFGFIKLSDAAVTYFISQITLLHISLILPGARESVLFTLSALSVLAVPVILFSLYYQYFKAKVWCKLCVAVISVLAVQIGIFGYGWYALNSFEASQVYPVAVIISLLTFLLIGAGILLIKNQVEKAREAERNEIKALRVKHNVHLFTHSLSHQKSIDTPSFNHELMLGSPDAPIKIIMASNLYCKPCKEQHEVISKLISSYADKVSVTLRFVRSGKNLVERPNSLQYLIWYWLQNIYGKSNEPERVDSMMHHWYAYMDLEKFKTKYPIETAFDYGLIESIESQHYDFAELNGIRRTPTFFINGHLLPVTYGLEDVLAMVPGLAHSFRKTPLIVSTLDS